MEIVQEAYYIPDDISTGLATGLYYRIGSVVRYATGPYRGRIVRHLQPIDQKVAEEAKGLGAKAIQFAQQHKKEIGIGVACAAVAGLGIWAYIALRNHEPKALKAFRTTLSVYIEAIRNGSMDIDKINALMNSMEILKMHKDFERISIQLSMEELDVLVGRIYEYTIKLARDNFVELTDEELHKNDGVIINLQSHLRAQKRVFESVA